MKQFVVPVLTAVVLVSALALVISSRLPGQPALEQSQYDTLPKVGSVQKLKQLLEEARRSGPYALREGVSTQGMPSTKSMAAPAAPAAQAADSAGYSGTNVQVQGVDEADVIKTDGKYIYQVNRGRVTISNVYPPEKMSISSNINLDSNFTARELYVDEKYLVVIGNQFMPKQGQPSGAPPTPVPGILPDMIYPGSSRLVAQVYDIADKAKVKKVREIEVDGDYLSSRKIGSSLYLVANKYINGDPVTIQATDTPAYRDSAGKGQPVNLELSEVRYFPGFSEPNYLVVGGIDLDQPDKEIEVAAYLGAGRTIYASLESLYVAVPAYPKNEPKEKQNSQVKPGIAVVPEANTRVFKFALEKGKTRYLATGEVPGTLLNQFSMDEFKGYFRAATTKGQVWRSDEYTSKNNIYVLDKDLKLAGKIEDIAPGERIYSVRFMGERAYMVTFKTVDPLFVLDLKDPNSPKIAGALKIPGYSDYLQPYDEQHIIGFGKDTLEKTQGQGQAMAYYQGLKLALFDVSDVEHPKEMFKEIIGDRGTDSDLLRNHKALLFDPSRGLLAFPVTLMEIGQKQPGSITQYGNFTFQGAYVYHLDLTKGFTLQGRITHLTPDQYQKTGANWYQNERNVERILYIGDTLYTVSGSMIKANNLADLKEINSLEF